MSKERFDYSLIHVADIDDVTTLRGKGINDLPKESVPYLANVGLLVMFQRSLAASKDCPLTLAEKQEKVDGIWNWLTAGMPKRQRMAMTAEERAQKQYDLTIAAIRDGVKSGTKQEKQIAEQIIAKIPKPTVTKK